ncbi:cytochrome P450 [Apiospora phragmitis]|uniref:Cytochrome P450 n=1 Tax=Apiospora phragmitis TaxID=2905665 RepID=A0ABR1V0A1_9PEZI
MFTLAVVWYSVAALLLAYWIITCIYNLYFHPLAKYPGPRFAAVSQLWYASVYTGGNWPFIIEQAHRKYGRLSPIPRVPTYGVDSDPDFPLKAFKEVYGGATKTKKLFTKSELFYDAGKETNIAYERDPDQHAVLYKLFAPSFRPQALRDQEYLIHNHVDVFVQQLDRWSRERSSNFLPQPRGEGTQLWLVQLTTMSCSGELAFGESFGAVKNGESHTWVSILLVAIYLTSVVQLKKRLHIMEKALPWLAPKKVLAEWAQHQSATLERVQKRMRMDERMGRTDLLTHPIRSGKLRAAEFANNAQVLLTAGAETSATTLTALTYLLATHAGCRARLADEVRAAFGSADQITAAAAGAPAAALPQRRPRRGLAHLPALAAGPAARVAGRDCGRALRARGIYVGCDTYSLHLHPRNAPSPRSFHPERWLVEANEAKPYTAAFSIGPRACLGISLAYIELRVALAKIVFALDWELVGEPFDWPAACRLTQLWKKAPLNVRYMPRGGGGVAEPMPVGKGVGQ